MNIPSDYEQINCPVCYKNDATLLDERTIDKRLIRTIMCNHCSHAYLNPRARAPVYDEYYTSGFSQEFNAISNTASSVDLAAGNDAKTRRILDFLKPHLNPNSRVLEIGCGYGNIIATLRDSLGASVTGIEPDPLARRVAFEAHGLELQDTSFDAFFAETQEKYDMIIMHHVLEHMLYPNDVVERLYKLLKDDGVLYLGVPNIAAMTFPKQLFFRFPHVSYFTPFSLFILLCQNGLHVVQYDSFQKALAIIAIPHRNVASVDWASVIRNSFPISKMKRVIFQRHWYHTVRLAIKHHIRPMLPRALKDFVKKYILYKI